MAKRGESAVALRRRRANHWHYDDRFTLLFFLTFVILLLFLFDAAEPPTRSSETNYLIKKLVINHPQENGLAFVVQDSVDRQKLQRVASMDYAALKRELTISSDFSVYFEDQSGNLVVVIDRYCIGSPRAKVAGVPCG